MRYESHLHASCQFKGPRSWLWNGRASLNMLAGAGIDVVGCDISPKMIQHAQAGARGKFTVSDMLTYETEGKFAAIFMIFSTLQLSYADFHSAAYKYANALQPSGILALGQMPADIYVKDDSSYDETKTYVEDYPAPLYRRATPDFGIER